MRVIDISMRLEPGMTTYGLNPATAPRHRVLRAFADGGVNESELTINLHNGTHLDSAFHMLDGGEPTEFLPLEDLITPCRVLDLTHVQDGITRADLMPMDIKSGEFLLFKTANSQRKAYYPGFVYIKPDAATYLAERRVKGVGIDALGVERDQPDHATHTALLSGGVIILEGLRLAGVAPGGYTLIALPVKIRDADGAPCRAVLIEGSFHG